MLHIWGELHAIQCPLPVLRCSTQGVDVNVGQALKHASAKGGSPDSTCRTACTSKSTLMSADCRKGCTRHRQGRANTAPQDSKGHRMWASMRLAQGAYQPQSGLRPGLPVVAVAGMGQLQWQTVLRARFWQAIGRPFHENVADQILLLVRQGCMHL